MKAAWPCPEPAPAATGRRAALGALAGLGGLAMLSGLALWPAPAAAVIPPDYAPLQIPARPADGNRIEFDLRPAIAQARQQGKRLYVYLGASDCPFCRRYEAFLKKNAAELKGHFAREWLVVGLESRLEITADRLLLRTGAGPALPYAEFQRSIGDERARMLVYPSVWVMDSQGKPLMQMPAGTGTFETVDEQLEILRLEQ